MRKLFVAIAAVALPAIPTYAVVVAGGDGTQNTTGIGVPGWEYVGGRGGASAIYLGNQWVLTAVHVGAGDLILPGRGNYGIVSNSAVTLVDPVTSLPTDMVMYRISADPGLPPLNIPDTSPTVASDVFMTGYGRNRSASLSYWSVNASNPNNVIWTPVANSGSATNSGYFLAPGNTKRWGTNKVGTLPGTSSVTGIINPGLGDIRVFGTSFSNLVNEGQGASGDSGGGVFDAGGRLIGMMNAIGNFANQPADTTIFGQVTYTADLSQYRNQILLRVNVIPEPSTALLLFPALALLARHRPTRSPA